jgi:streptogramin lyase
MECELVPRYTGLLLAIALLAGCGAPAGTVSVPAAGSPGGAAPDDIQRGDGNPQGSSFAIPDRPVGGIVAGPDRRMWFGTYGQAGAVSERGDLQMLPQNPQYAQLAGGLSLGPAGDGHLFYSTVDHLGQAAIARVTPPAGTLDMIYLSYPIQYVVGLAAGPDDAVYGAGLDSIVRVSADGRSVKNYPLPRGEAPSGALSFSGRPLSIALGPDSALWFTLPSTPYVGRFDPLAKRFSAVFVGARNTGAITSYDGALYMTAADRNDDYYVVKVQPGGGVSRIALPGSRGHYLQAMTVGPDGNLWLGGSGALWNISPLGAVGGPFTLGGVSAGPNYLAAGPDGNLWCLDETPQAILVYELHTLTVAPIALTLVVGQTASLHAAEASPAGGPFAHVASSHIATVVPESSGTFAVTAVSAGRTSLRVSDGKNNFVDVPVIVST